MKGSVSFYIFLILSLLILQPVICPPVFSLSMNLNNQSEEMNFQLENGLRVYLLQTSRYNLSSVVLAIKAGASSENEAESGLSHLMEHCLLFRQNDSSSGDSWQKARDLGLYINAHTDLETIFFEISLPSELLEEALSFLSNLIFDFKVTEEALEKEKLVILKELSDIARDPQKVGLSSLYSLAFPFSSYRNPVFGRKETIKKIRLEQLKNFHDRYFRPKNASLVIIGPYTPKQTRELVFKTFSDFPAGSQPDNYQHDIQLQGKIDLIKESRQSELTMHTSETYLMAGLLAPGYSSPDRPLMDVLVEILGYGINPLLYSPFYGNPDLISSLKINYFAHSEAGFLVILVITKKENVLKVKRLLENLFIRIPELNFSLDDYLPSQQFQMIDFMKGAKNRIKLLAEKNLENPVNMGISLSRHLLLSTESSRKDYLQTIEAVKSSDLRKLARRYFVQGKPVWIVINPGEK